MNEYRYEIRDLHGWRDAEASICFVVLRKNSPIIIAVVYSEEDAKLIVGCLNKVHDWNTKWTKGENDV